MGAVEQLTHAAVRDDLTRELKNAIKNAMFTPKMLVRPNGWANFPDPVARFKRLVVGT